jgi:hypothetical protein
VARNVATLKGGLLFAFTRILPIHRARTLRLENRVRPSPCVLSQLIGAG